MVLELAIDEAVHFVNDRVTVAQVAHVHAQFVVQGAGAEIEEVHVGLRVFEYPRVFLSSLEQQAFHQVQVRAVVHTQFEGDAGDGVGQGPVDQLPGDKGLVRDDDVFAVEVSDGVADTHRALEQDHDPGDKVGENFLHAEAQAY